MIGFYTVNKDMIYIWHLERERELCENIQLMDTSRERSWAIRLTLTFLRRIIRNIKPVTIFQQGRMNKTCGDCNAFVQILLPIFLFFLKSPLTIPSIHPSVENPPIAETSSPPLPLSSPYIYLFQRRWPSIRTGFNLAWLSKEVSPSRCSTIRLRSRRPRAE